jgi:ferric iron reductase protein FhuF
MDSSQARDRAAGAAAARPAEPATAVTIRTALDATAGMGPFFALELGVAGDGWALASESYAAGADEFLAVAGGVPDSAEPRVAASIAQLGYAARLWSPVVGAVLLGGVVPDLSGLRISASRPARLGVSEPRGWHADDIAGLAELSYRSVVERHLEPLTKALRDRVAPGLLWGNAASALAGALGMLAGARPELRGPAAALAGELLSTGRLAGAGDLGVTGAGLGFRRRSCCLYYRLPGGGLCGDCSLSTRPG